ncbi:MAG TPA: twin-arginine translocase TatA/TatE family subunit [Gemmatimonadales bacterium]|nr:twin-arginine translocase TatA/TatE family subunit [Gemmatimonadales bacterium]
MLGNLGGGEVVLLLVIALLVFGAHRLPEAGRTVGKGLREFRRALTEAQDAITRVPLDEPPPHRTTERDERRRLSD